MSSICPHNMANFGPLAAEIDPVVSCNWMSAASVAAVATSGERHEGKAGMVLFAGKPV